MPTDSIFEARPLTPRRRQSSRLSKVGPRTLSCPSIAARLGVACQCCMCAFNLAGIQGNLHSPFITTVVEIHLFYWRGNEPFIAPYYYNKANPTFLLRWPTRPEE